MDPYSILHDQLARAPLSAEGRLRFSHFCKAYVEATAKNLSLEKSCDNLSHYLSLIIRELSFPKRFDAIHRAERTPFDFYSFGLEFFKPLIRFDGSTLLRTEVVEEIASGMQRGENAILLANHQTEPDPQIISLMLEEHWPKLAEEMFFVAGHRVTTDPLAVPFSRGRNLICIYSKHHIEHPPELREVKQQHNRRAIQQLTLLLNQGGVCLYVAPSGGRDRPSSENGHSVLPAAFDPQSVELFRLLARRAHKPTCLYTLALATYRLLPPPDTRLQEMGEQRAPQSTTVHLAFNRYTESAEANALQASENDQERDLGKKFLRQRDAERLWEQVCADYKTFPTDE